MPFSFSQVGVKTAPRTESPTPQEIAPKEPTSLPASGNFGLFRLNGKDTQLLLRCFRTLKGLHKFRNRLVAGGADVRDVNPLDYDALERLSTDFEWPTSMTLAERRQLVENQVLRPVS